MLSKQKRSYLSGFISSFEAITICLELIELSNTKIYDQNAIWMMFIPIFLIPIALVLKNWKAVLLLSVVIFIFEVFCSVAIWALSHNFNLFFLAFIFGMLGVAVKYTALIDNPDTFLGKEGEDPPLKEGKKEIFIEEVP